MTKVDENVSSSLVGLYLKSLEMKVYSYFNPEFLCFNFDPLGIVFLGVEGSTVKWGGVGA